MKKKSNKRRGPVVFVESRRGQRPDDCRDLAFRPLDLDRAPWPDHDGAPPLPPGLDFAALRSKPLPP